MHTHSTAHARLTHPPELWLLAIAYAVFMCTFGTVIAELTLYLTSQYGFHSAAAYSTFAAFAALLQTLPFIGGTLSTSFGYQKSAVTGWLLAIAGMTLMAYPSIHTLYLGLSAYLVGNAFLTPAVWCLVTKLYQKNDPRRLPGSTLFYLFFNVGAVFGIFVGGWISTHYSYQWEFSLNAVLLALSVPLLLFITPDKSTHTVSHTRSWFQPKLWSPIFAMIPVTYLLLTHPMWNQVALYALCITGVVLLLRLAKRQKDSAQKKQLYAFLILSGLSILFWSLYNLEPSLLSVFIKEHVHHVIFGLNIPPASFFGFEGFFVIAVGLLMNHLWQRQRHSSEHVSRLPEKSAYSLLWMSSGFLYLAAIVYVNSQYTVPLPWMVISYVFFATGELLVGPVGIAMTGELAPSGHEGTCMGFWQIMMGLSAVVSEHLSHLSIFSTTHEITSSHSYLQLFILVGAGGILVGLVTMMFAQQIKKLLVPDLKNHTVEELVSKH